MKTAVGRVGAAVLMLWTVAVTASRAVRLPNNFSKEHWFIDYRFGFVKRGLVGTLVSLATATVRLRPTEQLVNILSGVLFVIFCVVITGAGLRIVSRSGWSAGAMLPVLVFLSSPFIVMSAHLIGYFDNIIIVLGVISMGLLFRRRIWSAVSLQVIALLVHENALLVDFPVFCLAWLLVNSRERRAGGQRLSLWPLLLPVGTFCVMAVSQSFAPRHLEASLTRYLSSYPFIAPSIGDVRVPHWITITFGDSYLLHRGLFLNRLLSTSILGLVLPSMLAILAFVVDGYGVRAVSVESIILIAVCLAPQTMHLVAWDTTRIWTYAIVCGFLALWSYTEVFVRGSQASQLVRLLCLVALVLNITEVTPLMDGLREHFDLSMRGILYAPVIAASVGWMLREESTPIHDRLSIQGRPE